MSEQSNMEKMLQDQIVQAVLQRLVISIEGSSGGDRVKLTFRLKDNLGDFNSTNAPLGVGVTTSIAFSVHAPTPTESVYSSVGY